MEEWQRRAAAAGTPSACWLYKLTAVAHDVRLETIQAPAGEYVSLLDLITKALEQERDVSRRMGELYQTTFDGNDFVLKSGYQQDQS